MESLSLNSGLKDEQEFASKRVEKGRQREQQVLEVREPVVQSKQ